MRRLFQFHSRFQCYAPNSFRRLSSNFYPDEGVSYAEWSRKRTEIIGQKLATNRFVPIESREERGMPDMELCKEQIIGKYQINYRGMEIMKGPNDIIVLQQLFWHLKPRSVIELGTYNGVCALWLSDTMRLISSPCQVYTMDSNPSLLLAEVREMVGDSVTFLEGDANYIDRVFPSDLMAAMEKPLVVLEDCHANLEGVICHFDRHMETGDYFVIEDTNPYNSKFFYLGDSHSQKYEPVGPDKLHCLREVISGRSGRYSVDTFFTDFFGYNSTNNWDGYLRKMKDT